MCIEAFLAVNLIADLALLAAVCRAAGIFSWRRIMPAGALCASYAAVAAAHPSPWASAPVQLVLLGAVSALLTARIPRLRIAVAAMLSSLALVCGGVASLLPSQFTRPALASLSLGIAALLCTCGRAVSLPFLRCWLINIRLCVGGRTARFTALVDTGNRLHEPVSGLPVLIAEAELLTGLLPESGRRELCFGAVGGGGKLTCFRPDAVWIDRGRRSVRAPDIWIAVSPGRLPGLFQALAPCEFALCIR